MHEFEGKKMETTGKDTRVQCHMVLKGLFLSLNYDLLFAQRMRFLPHRKMKRAPLKASPYSAVSLHLWALPTRSESQAVLSFELEPDFKYSEQVQNLDISLQRKDYESQPF